MAVHDFPKTWPPFVLRRFENFEKAYESVRDLVKGIEDFRKKVLEVDSTKGQPGFAAYLGSSQTITTVSTWETVDIDTEEWDTDDAFNTTTFRFTPLIPGIYLFIVSAQISSLAVGKRFALRILRNGSNSRQGPVISSNSATAHQLTMSVIFEADGIDDYFEFQIWQDDSTSESIVSGASATRFQAFRIGNR